MSYTKKLIELVKSKQGIVSDYAVAKLIGVTPQKMSDWKKERAEANAESTIKLIVAAGITAENALSIMTKNQANAGGALIKNAKQCILC